MKQLPLPKKPPTFKQPQRICPMCKKAYSGKFRTCDWECEREYQKRLAAIEAADKEKHEEPF